MANLVLVWYAFWVVFILLKKLINRLIRLLYDMLIILALIFVSLGNIVKNELQLHCFYTDSLRSGIGLFSTLEAFFSDEVALIGEMQVEMIIVFQLCPFPSPMAIKNK